MSDKTGIKPFDANWAVITEQDSVPQFHEDRLDQPLRWRKPRDIGVCFGADWMHDGVTDSALSFIAAAMVRGHRYFTLTKRPKRLVEKFSRENPFGFPLALPNVYHGVTVCNQEEADSNLPEILQIPGQLWVSFEPLLGRIALPPWAFRPRPAPTDDDDVRCARCGEYWTTSDDHICPKGFGGWLHWGVVGCESGPHRRPCRLEWILDLAQQFAAAGTPIWVKQIPLPDGRYRRQDVAALDVGIIDEMNDTHGWRVSKNPEEWPASLRVREKAA